MPALTHFLQRLLAEGDAVLSERPVLKRADKAPEARVLERAFTSYRLSIPGSLLDFDADSALAAADLEARLADESL